MAQGSMICCTTNRLTRVSALHWFVLGLAVQPHFAWVGAVLRGVSVPVCWGSVERSIVPAFFTAAKAATRYMLFTVPV
jgi:hypothetical protein